jgi:hypothetical protein
LLRGLVKRRIGQQWRSTAGSETATLAYLFALVLFLTTIYLAIGAGMTIFSLNTMIARGLRGERA